MSWEVFYTNFSNNLLMLTLDEVIGVVLSKELWRKSMGLTIDDNVDAHFSRGMTHRASRDHNWSRRRNDRQRSKSTMPNAYYMHCRKDRHNIFDCWMEHRFFQLESSFIENQIHVAKYRLGEVLSLKALWPRSLIQCTRYIALMGGGWSFERLHPPPKGGYDRERE